MASDGHLPEKTEEVAGTVVGIGRDSPEERWFRCCICKDLLYKPVVMACGHMSCFSCFHEVIKILGGPHCTVCRQSYKHFPNICKLLHHLLLKLEPTDYKKREEEVLAHGGRRCEKLGCQKEAEGRAIYCKAHDSGRRCKGLGCTKSAEGRTDFCKNHGGGRRCKFSSCTKTAEDHADHCIHHCGSSKRCSRVARGKSSMCTRHGGGKASDVSMLGKKSKKISLKGVSCRICKEILYQPAVLNCGHVYCISCLSSLNEEALQCQVCGDCCTGVFPSICLDLDHFLKENFPTEYESKQEKVKGLGNREASSSSTLCAKQSSSSQQDDDRKFSHTGAGCDSCGVHPIQGKRYRCQDCSTSIGFNLCEACHNSRSKFPRRLNQQHTPDHRMEVDNSTLLKRSQGFHSLHEEGPCNMEDKRYKDCSFGSPVSTEKSPSFQGGGGETSPRFEQKRLTDELDGDCGTKLPMEIESSSLEKDNSMHDSPSRHTQLSWWCKTGSFSISDETNNFVSTSVSTYDQKRLTAGLSPSPYRESTGVIDNKEKIAGRIGDKYEIVGSIDGKHEEINVRAIDKLEVMQFIMSHDPTDTRYTIVCIVGADGIGKTTLASLVYCDGSMCISFEARAWLWLSDVYDYEELLRSVIASLTGVSCRFNDRDELEEVLKEELIGKRFLLVLDNLCENNVEVCRKLSSLLSVADKGSAVIVTTSSNMVAGHLGTTHSYNLKALMSSSFLIMAKPNFIEYPPLGGIISKIPSECSGLLMFAKAIRGILYSACTQNILDDTVKNTLIEILSKQDNHLHNLLYLSYSYLIPNQQMCLLYCSLFPIDYTYNKEKLLRLWMSQGFVIPDNEKHGHDNCEDACDELLHRSFFDYSPLSEVEEQKYVMHEITSHLARSVSGNKFFRAHGHDLHCMPRDVQHLSISPSYCDSKICFSSFTEFRELSTLLLVHNTLADSVESQFHVMDVKALDECFRNFRCLKTLDLSHTDIRELPDSIGYISSLRFLGLNNTNIRNLPDSVCNLFNLQTLELKNSAFLVELPNDIKNLNCLYHLDASKENGLIYVPPGIGQLTNLQTLTTFTVGGVSWNCKVSELAHMNSLTGFLHIQSLNNVENAEDAKGACLAAKKLKKLSLEWSYSGEDIENDSRTSVAKHVLEALKPHRLLGELSIKGYYGLEFPSWITDRSLSDLVSITLDNCCNCEKLPPLGALPVLRYLFIQNLRRVQIINCDFWAGGTINHNSFPKLEILKLRDMYDLEYWYDMLYGVFPSLRSLSIERCPKLKCIPFFQYISDISIVSCSKLNLPGLQSLQSLKIGNLRQRTCFALPFELRSLLRLEVICCEHLGSVKGLSQLQSLKHLKFKTCPRLNFIQDEPLPDTLGTVDIHSNCYALSNWVPNGFEELPDASEVYRKFIKRKCEAKGVDDAVMHDSTSH